MESCFPPLASLRLQDGGPKSAKEYRNNEHQEHRVLQDLELYYIKQIAHNLKELDLEQKIELEIKMREGTTKLLQACKHQSQSLEAAKSLLTSNERMTAYMAELQRRKRQIGNSQQKSLPDNGCKARLCLSGLRIPLLWRDTDHFKNKGDYRRFAVFCLAKIGTEMFDTSLLCPIDRSLTDITFPDILVFNQVPSDFTCVIEVYSHMLRDDMSMASTRRKIKNTIHTSISRTVGKKLAASLRDELNSGHVGPQFDLMASARLTLDDVNDDVRTYDLKLIQSDGKSEQQLPLFNHFCVRIAAQPYCLTKEIISGGVTLAKPSTLSVSWANLIGFKLNLWQDRKQCLQSVKEPSEIISVDTNTIIKCSKNGNDIVLVNEVEGKEISRTLKFNNGEEREQWLTALIEHIRDHTRWKSAVEKIMEIYTPGTGKQNFIKPPRQGSLYDETPLIDTHNHHHDFQRPTVQDIFNSQLTPSTTSLSSSCSTSTTSSSPTFYRERSSSTASKTRSRWPIFS